MPVAAYGTRLVPPAVGSGWSCSRVDRIAPGYSLLNASKPRSRTGVSEIDRPSRLSSTMCLVREAVQSGRKIASHGGAIGRLGEHHRGARMLLRPVRRHEGEIDEVASMSRFIPTSVRMGEQLLRNARSAIQDFDGKRVDCRACQGNAPFRDDLELDGLFVDPKERSDPVQVCTDFTHQDVVAGEYLTERVVPDRVPQGSITISIRTQEIEVDRLSVLAELQRDARSTAEVAPGGSEQAAVQGFEHAPHQAVPRSPETGSRERHGHR